MITLPHSRLRAPHDRLRVSSLQELEMYDGVAFTATLRLDGQRVGVIEDDGHGGGTVYRPDPGSRFGYDELNAFAAACRRDDEPVSTEGVLNDLVTECDLTLRITRASATGGTLLRLVAADGYTTDLATVRPVLTTAAQRQRAAAEVAKPDDDGHWQMLTGQAWEPLTGPADSQAGPLLDPPGVEVDNEREDVYARGVGEASPSRSRRPGTRIVAELDHGARTVLGIEVRITELVWNGGGRSFDVHRVAADGADGADLTADGSFDEPPTDEQIAALLCPHIEQAQTENPLP